jgi:hypothetical protein
MEFLRYHQEVLFVNVANHRDDEAGFCIHGHADVEVLFKNDLMASFIHAGVCAWVSLQRSGDSLQEKRRQR